MIFLDANVILRYLTADVPEKAERCLALFQRADRGEVELTTSEAIIAEVVYVPSSKHLYHLDRGRIREILLPVVHLRGLKAPSRSLLHQALETYATHSVDFEDALAVAHMRSQGMSEIVSYGQHSDRIEGVRRIEP